MQRFAAETTHWALYALLVVQPFTGWIATSAYRAPVVVFGWFQLPPIWPQDRAFSDHLFAFHALTGIAIACLAAAHISAALPSFRAQGSRPPPHDQRLTVAQTDHRRS